MPQTGAYKMCKIVAYRKLTVYSRTKMYIAFLNLNLHKCSDELTGYCIKGIHLCPLVVFTLPNY